MEYNSHIIYERTRNIPIKKNLYTTMKADSSSGEYSLKQNFFDPSKSSPPNEFLLKLQMRMSLYDSTHHNIIKDDKRDSE
jgi:hypothetical protein